MQHDQHERRTTDGEIMARILQSLELAEGAQCNKMKNCNRGEAKMKQRGSEGKRAEEQNPGSEAAQRH